MTEHDSLIHRIRETMRRREESNGTLEQRPLRLTAEEYRARARAEMGVEFHRRTAGVGSYERRWNPPLVIEEALTPGKSREPGGHKWANHHAPRRNAS
jgi:hypothetical protein